MCGASQRKTVHHHPNRETDIKTDADHKRFLLTAFLAATLRFFPECDAPRRMEPAELRYRSGTVNSNTVNSKFHVIRSHCEIFFDHFPNISCLKCTVNLNFHFIRSKTLLTKDFELTVPDLYCLSSFILCEPSPFSTSIISL